VPKGTPADDSFVGSGRGLVYDQTGLRDPFRSFEWERREFASLDMVGGPLEQFDVSQLSVIAVVWKTGSARALVEDPAGQSYIIGKGTRIGKNDGMVTEIDDNLVVVNETYEDYLGNITKKDIEMRIRRSEGG
jgi:type IV pilus assembly protein PilP